MNVWHRKQQNTFDHIEMQIDSQNRLQNLLNYATIITGRTYPERTYTRMYKR